MMGTLVQALSIYARKKGEGKENLISVEGKLDTCGSVSLSHSSHLQQVKGCRKYGLKEVVLSGIGGKSKPLREAGVLHVRTNTGAEKKILCYRYDECVGNTEQILLLSLRTIRDANIDILHHMDQSLDGISSPLLFLQDKDVRINKRKGVTRKARASEKFLRQQRKKKDRDNSCVVLLASNTTAATEHVVAGPQDRDERQLHCLLDTDDENGHGQVLATLMRGLTIEAGSAPTLGSLEGATLYSFEEHEAFMSEIQLRGIVEKMAREASSQGTDGD
jgi:hypothetical protein